jgi:putative phosphoribosyl transferase
VTEVRIPPHALAGTLILPAQPLGVVAFAHGSGSGRFSPRNRLVAARLNKERLGTLLVDLLVEAEADDRRNVFDFPLLAGRLGEAIDFLCDAASTQGLPIGLFGASTCELDVVPNATHLFEEPGTLEQVAERAARWFRRCCRP